MSTIQNFKISEPYLESSCSLGEGPYWETSTNSLRFVDIVEKKLHTVDLKIGAASHKQWDLAFSIGHTADIEGNDVEFIFGGKRGYGIFNKRTGEHHIIKEMWTDDDRKPDGGGKPNAGKHREERMRSNDGAVDANGRYFIGTMNDNAVVGPNVTDEGILFRLDPDLSLHRVKNEITIPNGTSWTADNSTIYFTDSPTRNIMAYPYDVRTGEIAFSKGRVFFTCPIEGGVPDGHCQDVEGHLWVACFGTGRVFRVDPQGEIVAEIEVPTRCVTCPVFCGTELFITTAAEEEPEKYEWSKKYQGALFKIDVGIKGRPVNKFTMKLNP